MTRRRKTVLGILLAGLGIVGVAAFFHADRIAEFYQAMRLGYRFEWMPDGVSPWDMNDAGQVAVNRLDVSGLMPERAGRWSVLNQSLQEIQGDLAKYSLAWGINDKGNVAGVGASETPFAPGTGFLWRPEEGVILKIPPLGNWKTIIVHLNDHDQVAGVAMGENWMSGGTYNVRAFTWEPGAPVRRLPSLQEGGSSSAFAINNDGWVVGDAQALDGQSRPVLWRPGKPVRNLGLVPGFTAGRALAVNDVGMVLVELDRKQPDGETVRSWFFWRSGPGYERLSVPSEHDGFWAGQLTDSGLVLLAAHERRDSGIEKEYFLRSNTKAKKLPQPLSDTSYLHVNDHGWLAGIAREEKDRPRRGFVAIPVW